MKRCLIILLLLFVSSVGYSDVFRVDTWGRCKHAVVIEFFKYVKKGESETLEKEDEPYFEDSFFVQCKDEVSDCFGFSDLYTVSKNELIVIKITPVPPKQPSVFRSDFVIVTVVVAEREGSYNYYAFSASDEGEQEVSVKVLGK